MSRNLRILVVEDNRADADLIRELLPAQGPLMFQIESVARLAEAITRLERKGIDLILLDLGLPDSQGLATFRNLRQAVPDVPVIVLSGASDEELAVTAVQEGAQDYLVKGMVGGSLLARAARYAVERQRGKDELGLANQRMALHIEQTPLAVIEFDYDGRVREWNPAAVAIFGFSREEAIGQYWHFIVAEPVREQLDGVWNALVSQRGGSRSTNENRTKDGRTISCEWFNTPLIDSGGRNIGVASLVQDVSEQKRAEVALRESERDFRILAEAVPQIIWATRPDGGNIYFNQHWVDYTGLTLEESYGPGWIKPFHPDDQPRAWQAWQNATQNNGTYSLECRLRRADGVYRWWLIRGEPLFDADGKVVKWFGTCTDIEDIKQEEVTHARLTMAVEQAAETIVITDTKGMILYANPAFEKTTGYTCAEALGQNPRVLKSGKHDPAYYRQLWETLQSGQIWNGHFINKRKDGTLYEEEATISPIRDAAGKTISFVTVKRDVTHEVELEGQLRQSQKMEAMGTLAGGIAHDFNNILNVIFGYSNLLQMDLAGKPDELEKLGEILKAGERAKDLVQQILTFSRQREQARQVIYLNPIIKEVTKLLRSSMPANLQIETELAADAPAVLADATQIYQVIMNLGTNALHAMEKQASGRLKITLDAFAPDAAFLQTQPELRAVKYARLTISDTGCGMDEKTLARIYDPFFTTKPVGKGTGLGLAVVHGIVKAHDGLITVESQPGQGTAFRIYLPGQIPDMFLAGIPENLIPCGQGQRILMVDDEVVLVGMNQKLLKALKYEGTIVTDPEEAVEMVRKNPVQFDLIITDLTMPKLSGLEVARQIREFRADMPVILATGFHGTVTKQQMQDAGICELVGKPISMARLATVLHGILGKK